METIDLERSELLLHRYAEDAYLEYAMAVVTDRALCQVQDGNKPVQRRILYTMKQLGLNFDSKQVKSARIVGEVLGKYHPHGDGSVYDAMVRMAQPFTLRYPLVQGQGNFGSRDGDPAAAMRYTEARLSAVATLMLEELNQGTVDFKPNYDGTLTEPVLHAARLPFLLLNGTLGIAVGMASSIPSHNLREVGAAAAHCVLNPTATTEELLSHMPGPDFPDGGQIISSPQEIASAYTSGRGAVRVRSRWRREDLARGQWQIVIQEMPYQVSGTKVLEEIDALCNPTIPANKKSLTPQQIALKQIALDFLETARDESSEKERIRLVIVPRTSKIDEAAMMAFLLANTSLEDNFSFNLTMMGLNGAPSTKSLATMLHEWAQFRVVTVRRRCAWQLESVNGRIHILEGRLTVYLNLDGVLKIIRFGEEPKAELMSTFSLSDRQAEDILEMRLRQLSGLENLKLEAELASLRKEAARLQELLDNDGKLRKLVVTEINESVAKYGDDRRSLIQPEARAASSAATTSSNISEEPLTVIVSKNLWVRTKSGHGLDRSTLTYKAGDEAGYVVETQTTAQVIFMDHTGRVYSVAAKDIPGGRGDGVPLSTLIEPQPGARIVSVFSGAADSEWLFAGAAGYGFTAPLKSCVARPRAGKVFLKVDEGELALPVQSMADVKNLACLSNDGRLLVFAATEVKQLAGGGKGVMLMALEDGQTLAQLRALTDHSLEGQMTVKGAVEAYKLEGDDFTKYVLKRARKGYQLPKKGLPA